jgi:putative nucleotidyltransferase with HDIG domain
MANLAEAAAAAIGADALLTRVGAYYHDLGKTVQPEYFIENLPPSETSPHADLDPQVSADAIMAHVVLGTKILREGGIPEPVVEFAYTHHGTQLVEYFWGKHQAENERRRQQGEPVADLEEAHFRYPGMTPLSRETAILMLVDAIEAASRTVQPPERDKFEEMIRRVVFHKLRTGQLDESGLTLVDLRIMVERMASALVNMYHGRIKYPWQQRDSLPGARPSKPEEGGPASLPDLESLSDSVSVYVSESGEDSEAESELARELPAVMDPTSLVRGNDQNKEQRDD